MNDKTLMTDQAATTTESQSASQSTDQAVTGTDQTSQQADGGATDGKKDGQPKTGAPESYEFKAPEGKEFDSAVLEQFSTVAKELDLPQDKAQLLLDRMAPALQARQTEQIAAIHEDWASKSRADAEFGGAQLQENLGVAKKVLDTFGSPELGSLLKTTGLGNHPEVIRFMVRAGKSISEDGVVTGGSVKQGGDARSLYSKSNMNP